MRTSTAPSAARRLELDGRPAPPRRRSAGSRSRPGMRRTDRRCWRQGQRRLRRRARRRWWRGAAAGAAAAAASGYERAAKAGRIGPRPEVLAASRVQATGGAAVRRSARMLGARRPGLEPARASRAARRHAVPGRRARRLSLERRAGTDRGSPATTSTFLSTSGARLDWCVRCAERDPGDPAAR